MTLPTKEQFAVNKFSNFFLNISNTRSRFLFLALALLCGTLNILTPAFAQTKGQSHDYIATDSSLTTGKVSSLGKGKFEFRHHRNSPPILFGPNDVREYGDGELVYESLEIGGERIFYQRLANGPATLYKNKKSYLLKFNDSLTHLNKQNYRAIFEQNLVCEGGNELISTVAYTSASMTNFVNRVNHGKCTSAYLPYRRIGIYGGYSAMQFDIEFSAGSSFKADANSLVIGLFFDYPLYKPRSLFLSGEVFVVSLKPSSYSEKGNQTEYAGLDITGFFVPLGLKWMVPGGSIRPYFKGGPVLSYLKFNSEPEHFKTNTSGSVVEVIQDEISGTNSFQIGFDAAAGLELPLGGRKNLHFECKYLNAYNVSDKGLNVNCSGLFLIAGFNF